MCPLGDSDGGGGGAEWLFAAGKQKEIIEFQILGGGGERGGNVAEEGKEIRNTFISRN